MSEFIERRSVARLSRSERVTVTVAAQHSPTGETLQFQCNTVDISPKGVQIRCAEQLRIETPVDICIAIHGSPCKYFLGGQVVYSNSVADGNGHFTGIALNEKPTADLLSWQAIFTD